MSDLGHTIRGKPKTAACGCEPWGSYDLYSGKCRYFDMKGEIERLQAELADCQSQFSARVDASNEHDAQLKQELEQAKAHSSFVERELAAAIVARDLNHEQWKLVNKEWEQAKERERQLREALIHLSAALSEIDYLCGEPNDMHVSGYDVHCSETAVIEAVRRLKTALTVPPAPPEDAEKEAWLDGRARVEPEKKS